MVVHFCGLDPKEHWQKVRKEADVRSAADRITAVMKMGAWSMCLLQKASEDESPRSAGFSRAQATPARWAAMMRRADSSARALCFAM